MSGAAEMFSRWLLCWWIFGEVVLPIKSNAGVGDWKNFTNMKTVRAVVSDGATLWAATSGGLFRFHTADSTYQKFTNSEGLTSNDVTALYLDQSGNVWIGQQSGAIDVYNPKTHVWRYITDIVGSSNKIKTINSFYQDGDKVYIGTGFGVTVFSIQKFEFVDTYNNFSSAVQPNVKAVRIFQNRIFAVTDRGIATSNSGASNLAAPESWTITLALQSGNSLIEFNGTLYAGSGSGLFRFQNENWLAVNNATTPSIVFSATNTSLSFLEVFAGGNLKSMDAAGFITAISPLPDIATSGCATSNNAMYIGFTSNGIGTVDSIHQQWNFYFPNGPAANSFAAIAVDDQSVVWGVAGRSSNTGFYSYDGKKWRNYSSFTDPLIPLNYCFAVEIGPNNTKWVSTWGRGLIVLNSAGEVIKVFNNSDPGFIGVSEGITYVVPGKIAVDQQNNVWVTIFRSADQNKVVWKMKPDSSWEAYKGSPYGIGPEFMFGIVVDQNNTKWFTNTVSDFTRSSTIVFFNESQNVSGTVDGWGTITANDGATSTQVQSIVLDKGGNLWMGTGAGVTIITNPTNPTNRVSKVFQSYINDQSINCIAVDAQDNKWLGTKSRGVFVLSSDGTQLLQNYTAENTNGQLIDNNILSLAFDKKKGIMYFGTEKGLSSLEIAAIAAKPTLSTIDLSPNPVYLLTNSSVEIRGLVDESFIKILSVNGKVIKQFAAQGGGRAFWDCKDSDGRNVSSGIYIIVAHDRTGAQVASGKIAVIRK
ncbi:MAG: two-component regulator propeller domain-containing protein [Bacteroidota bacterium]|nr:two-component regulator propeller domain-containing protein [Bacteroidota bacterium]